MSYTPPLLHGPRGPYFSLHDARNMWAALVQIAGLPPCECANSQANQLARRALAATGHAPGEFTP